MAKRQFWRVRNTSNRTITVSDLPDLPTFAPNQVHDLFRYYSIIEIEQSQNLLTLMNRGTFEMVKQSDSSNRFIKSVTSNKALSNAEEDEVDLSISANNASYYTKDEIDVLIANPDRTLTVTPDPTPMQFSSIEDAITQINAYGDAAVDNRYVIKVTTGTYTESNPLVVPDYVSIMGNNDEDTVILANDNNAHLFTMGNDTVIYYIMTDGPTGVGMASVLVSGGNIAELIRVSFTSGACALLVDGVGTEVICESLRIQSTITNGLVATDNGLINASNIFSEANGNSYYSNGGEILLHNSFTRGAINALYADNAGILHAHLINIRTPTNALRTGMTGANTIIGQGIESDGTSTWEVLQEAASGIVKVSGCTFLVTKFSMIDASNIYVNFYSDFRGDESNIFMTEMVVGQPEQGRESVFGEGDSYTRGMLVYTETDGNVFTDVSAEAASPSGSTFTFTDVTQNSAIYVSSDLQDSSDYKQFMGIKVIVTIATVLGAGNIVAEYWDGTVGGGSWVEFNHMSTSGNAPYAEFANNIFERVDSEQIRFDDLSDTTRFDWEKNDPPSEGTNRFWIRLRVDSDITTAPTFQQFKVHSNRTEINADGFVEHMGKARKMLNIPGGHMGNTLPVVGKTPGNESIMFSTSITLSSITNKFSNNASDGFGQIVSIPEGLDTSLPLHYTVRWAPSTDTASGDVVLDLICGIVQVGTVLDGTNAEATVSGLITTTVNTAEQVYETTLSFSVPAAIPEDDIVFMLQRQASGGTGPTGDTYGGNIYIVSVDLSGTFWH